MRLSLIFFGALTPFLLVEMRAQEDFMDDRTRFVLDSLDKRIEYLNEEIPRLSKSRSLNFYYKRVELDQTIFLSHYHRYVFDEDLERAQDMIASRIKTAKKRNDQPSLKFYNAYKERTTQLMMDRQRHYQELFAREKNFRKELYTYIRAGDEYSLMRARRMMDLAIRYATDRNLQDVLQYLHHYSEFVDATIYNHNSEYDLNKLVKSERQFQRVFQPLVESDSLEHIKTAGELVDQCYSYTQQVRGGLDTSYLALQKNVVSTSIADYYARIGNNASLDELGDQAIIARMDTLNRAGIYKWHDKILVIGHFIPESKSKDVQQGEAIIDADRKLIRYIRINKLARIGTDVEMGQSVIIPYIENSEVSIFMFNPAAEQYQYMVCYSRIQSLAFTEEVIKFLPPVQFKADMESEALVSQ